MSSPHVAGAVALLLEARPTVSARDVKGILQNNADPKFWFGNPALGFLDNAHRQGAGMLNIVESIRTDVVVSPSNLALGEIESGTMTKRLTLKVAKSPLGNNDHASKTGVTYMLGHEPALATGANTFVPSFLSSFGTATFSSPTITYSGSTAGRVTVDVTFSAPANANARLFGGYITLTPSNGGPVLRVPYAGYNGDYQAISALVPTANNFPWLARLSGTTFTNQPSGATFTLVGEDIPHILVHLDHAVENLFLEVVDVTTGQSRGYALQDKHLPRNSGATTFFDLPWDGTVGDGSHAVANGTYRIELSVLKALGDKNNAAHRQLWSSPNITIARPPS